MESQFVQHARDSTILYVVPMDHDLQSFPAPKEAEHRCGCTTGLWGP